MDDKAKEIMEKQKSTNVILYINFLNPENNITFKTTLHNAKKFTGEVLYYEEKELIGKKIICIDGIDDEKLLVDISNIMMARYEIDKNN